MGDQVPGLHNVHLVAAGPAQVPALQSLHTKRDVAPTTEDHVPALQLIHEEEAVIAQVPAAQVTQLVTEVA
jgi:hypothetical protein